MSYRGTPKWRMDQPGPSPYAWPAVLVGVFLILTGLAAIAFRVVFWLEGGMPLGFWTVVDNTYVAYRLAAEMVTALLALAGGYGLVRGRRWGAPTSLVALGGLLFATISALGSSVIVSPELTPVFVGLLGATLLGFIALHFGRR